MNTAYPSDFIEGCTSNFRDLCAAFKKMQEIDSTLTVGPTMHDAALVQVAYQLYQIGNVMTQLMHLLENSSKG